MTKLVPARSSLATPRGYETLLRSVSALLEEARRSAARSVNTIITATYWEIGRRVVEYEQGGKVRADYGEQLLIRLGEDLTEKYGRGFSRSNLQQMRLFYLGWEICQTPSGTFETRVKGQAGSGESPSKKPQTPSTATMQPIAHLPDAGLASAEIFLLSWSHYVRLLSVEEPEARAFYEAEAIRGGWSVRQLDRQISTLFYERTALSRHKAVMLRKGAKPQPGEPPTAEEEIKDPFVLEFLGLKDEYSEHAMEERAAPAPF